MVTLRERLQQLEEETDVLDAGVRRLRRARLIAAAIGGILGGVCGTIFFRLMGW